MKRTRTDNEVRLLKGKLNVIKQETNTGPVFTAQNPVIFIKKRTKTATSNKSKQKVSNSECYLT